LGPKLHFIRSTQTATSASAAMGENSERSARLGLLLRAGAGVFLGRGALVLELHQEFLNSNHAITDYHNVANFSAMAGYVLLI
jgi:hypothetical protein